MKIRLALRVEGDFWNAYIAKTGTMDDSQLIGSIAIGPVTANPDLKQRFMDLMMDSLTETAKQTGGDVTSWTIRKAPEHERSGNA